ncbi:MAG: rRNA pseudouridine synthase [Candidatus Aureabacteria bacterium]|nr:rRNA pseudouridine synthase [Candidatus Auribacterota bacterium]
MALVRLQKYLSECGVSSRRKAEQLISEKRISVNGNVISKPGTKVDPVKDIILLNKKRLYTEKKKYILVYKPRGVISTMKDNLGRKIVKDLLNSVNERIYNVGRLDKDSEGLLLMTNDGNLANKLTHPSTHIQKTYLVTIDRLPNNIEINKLENGIIIERKKTLPAKIRIIKKSKNNCILEFIIFEGRKRQIRNMLAHIGIKTLKLKRIKIGNIQLGNLQPGHTLTISRKTAYIDLEKNTK